MNIPVGRWHLMRIRPKGSAAQRALKPGRLCWRFQEAQGMEKRLLDLRVHINAKTEKEPQTQDAPT